MEISLQVSYYPLNSSFNECITSFLQGLEQYNHLQITVGQMSTLINGDYFTLMRLLTEAMYPLLEKYPSVFTVTISNACNSCSID